MSSELEKLMEKWKEDSTIHDVDLDREALNQPKLHCEWLDILTKFKIKLYKIERDITEKKAILTEYYMGRMTKDALTKLGRGQYLHKTPLKSELEKLLEADELVIDLMQKFYYYTTIVEYATSVLGAIKDRGFSIKNAIEYRKFIAGN